MLDKNDLMLLPWVAAGGAAGALLRYWTSWIFSELLPGLQFFTATYFENILGSFLMGFLFIYLIKKRTGESLQLFLLTGLIGSYTTYSGFGLEALELFRDSPSLFFLYVISQVITGLLALVCGLKTAGHLS